MIRREVILNLLPKRIHPELNFIIFVLMDGWIKVFSSDKPVQIEVVKSALQENGINAVEISKKDSSYIFGEVEVYVKAESEIDALLILSQLNL